jgi:hypothetical protein
MANDESISNILPKNVKGLKYFKALCPLLERLHEVGKERDKAKGVTGVPPFNMPVKGVDSH